ncbi:MAG TPA: endonuclease domain-containing protein [Sphingomonadaceae bacterium]|nr:endonuclease domain-containing protein [Sphingomonadaceae bacterium]
MLERAANMRRNPTEPERRLWQQLRASRLKGCKFRRQAAIGKRIADFFCPTKGLIVELDGGTHDRARDLARDADIEAGFGYRTIRFTNEDVMRNMEGVLVALNEALEEQPDRWASAPKHHPPAPSSEEEGVQ